MRYFLFQTCDRHVNHRVMMLFKYKPTNIPLYFFKLTSIQHNIQQSMKFMCPQKYLP